MLSCGSLEIEVGLHNVAEAGDGAHSIQILIEEMGEDDTTSGNMLGRASDICLCPQAHQRRFHLQYAFVRDSDCYYICLCPQAHPPGEISPPKCFRQGQRLCGGVLLSSTQHRKKSMGCSPSTVIHTYILPPVLSTCPLHTNSECGKERRILINPW